MKRFKARQIYLLFISILGVFLISGCGGGGDTGHWEPRQLASIEVTPPNPSIAKGTTQQFMATGIYSDKTTIDLTTFATWNSSDETVATISNTAGSNGLATSKVRGGPITITATDPATGKTGTTTLTVTDATLSSIGITPVNRSIALGTQQPFIATGIYSDLTTQDLTSSVTWSSSNAAVATISNAPGSNGVATSKSAGGPITITATDPTTGKAGTATLTVTNATLSSIGVTPANRSIALGTQQSFIATGIYSDFTTQDLTSSVTWSSSNAAVATISNAVGSNGVATSKAAGGPITITATDPATGTAGTATLTVTAAALSSIGVTPVNRSIALGTQQSFIATGIYSDFTTQDLTSSVTWSSSNAAVAIISNAIGSNGVATSQAAGGPITITATDPTTGKAGTATLTVTPATLSSIGVTPPNPSIAKGTTQQFTATGIYSDATTKDLTTSVTWTTTPLVSSVATISNAAGFKGLATALTVGGPITITATDPTTGKAGTATLTVTPATLSSIGVTPPNPSIAKGTTQQFKATGIYSDATTKDLTSFVTWTTTPLVSAVATISNAAGFNGLATALTVGGPITITATDPTTGKAGTATLTVTAATLVSIGVTPVNPSIALGTNQQFIATGIFSDLTTKDLTLSATWTSSDETVATISNAPGFNGLATSKAVSAPSITITATSGLISGNTTLTVTAATLVSIGVTPPNPSIAKGTTQQFKATGIYSDATTKDLTSFVTWTTTPLVSPVATISNAPGFNGLATALTVGGPITITATDPTTGKAGTATLTVTAITLSSIAVTPVNPSIALGTTQQFVATGTYSDLTTQDLTLSVTWSSSDETVATISNAPGFNGLASSLATGITTITATSGLISGNTTLTVTAATLVSLAVTPATAGISIGDTQQFIATGTYSDATTQDLTSSVTWTTTPLVSPVATISNAAGFNGLATALTVGGPITITATDPTTLIAGTAALTVTNAPKLGAAKPFGGFGGGAGMTNQGILTVITGDIGTTGVSTTMTGFHDSTGDKYIETPLNIGDVKGRIYTAPPPPVIFGPGGPFGGTAATKTIADAAAADALIAYNYLAGLPGGAFAGAGELGGLNLPPGTYTSATSFKITSGDLTLTGTASDVWIFQMGSSLTVGAPGFPRKVILAGGALPKNVFWQVGSAARIENQCEMVGTIIASAGVTISTAGELSTTKLDGRALGLNASVTMVNTLINVPE